MRIMQEAESRCQAAWMRGLRSRDWEGLNRDLSSALVESFDRGALRFLPEGDSLVDIQRFADQARRMTLNAYQRVEPMHQSVKNRLGEEMTAILYLLFFDDDEPLRPLSRGVPSRIARRARRNGISMADARTAYEAVTQADGYQEARALVRTIPRLTSMIVTTEARRAVNLGIADSALAEVGVDVTAPSKPFTMRTATYPLWEIREVMDERTRGNPSGIYSDDGFHWQVNGYVNTMAELVRQNCVPPCGRNCRASLHPVTYAEAERMRLVRADGTIDFEELRDYNGNRQQYIDRGLYPDPGYR